MNYVTQGLELDVSCGATLARYVDQRQDGVVVRMEDEVGHLAVNCGEVPDSGAGPVVRMTNGGACWPCCSVHIPRTH